MTVPWTVHGTVSFLSVQTQDENLQEPLVEVHEWQQRWLSGDFVCLDIVEPCGLLPRSRSIGRVACDLHIALVTDGVVQLQGQWGPLEYL